MKQKLQDYIIQVKQSRKMQFWVGVGILAILFVSIYDSSPKGSRLVRSAPEPVQQDLIPKATADDVIEAFKLEVEQLKAQTQRLQKESDQDKKVMDAFEGQVVNIFKKMLGRMTENEKKIDDVLDNLGKISNNGGPASQRTGEVSFEAEPPREDPNELVEFGDLAPVEPAPPPPPPIDRVAYVGAGDSVEVELISGVNAPTDGTPYPALFKLIGSVTGPDGSALPLGEARLIAAAQGQLSDSRALFRLSSLNISLPNGERKVYNVDGWIVGEDGIHGMPGIPIDPLGRAIAGAAIVGGVQGLGQGLQIANQTVQQGINNNGNANVVSSVTGSAGEFAAGSAVTGAATQWNQLLRERFRDMTPVIKLYSGRKATAVFSSSLPIEGLYQQIVNPNADFDSLD